MSPESIPLTKNGLPDQDKIDEATFNNLPADQQAAINRMRIIAEKRKPTKPVFTPVQIAGAKENAAFQDPRQQGENDD